MSRTVELLVPNQAEYFLRNPALTLQGEERARVIRFGGTYECEHSVFWSTADRVLLLPEGYDPVWFADVHEALGVAEPPVVTAERRSGLLVQDFLGDGPAQQRLRELVSGASEVSVLMFGPTPSVYQLAATLRGWGLEVSLDCVAEQDYWASVYLDSKISCLDLARRMPQVNVADGMTVGSHEELGGALEWMVERHGAVIVRSLHGVAGDGSSVVRAGDGAVEAFLDKAARDSFFVYPLLVQKFVEHAEGVGCPAVDLLVDDDGVRDVVLCSLTVDDGHLFRSVNVGAGALPPEWAERVTQVAHDLGNAARELGYRGWMCVDCVAGTDDRLYVTEINARRSGSIHAGSLMREWDVVGQMTMSAHFMVSVPPGRTYEEHVRPIFQELWAEGVRAYPTTVRGMGWPEPIIAVLAGGSTAQEAEDVVARIRAAVSPPEEQEGVVDQAGESALTLVG